MRQALPARALYSLDRLTSADFANPDSEIIGGARPGLLTTNGPVLMVSSAYAKTGLLYNSYKRYFGPDGPADIIVAYGSSRDMNPSLSQVVIDRALEEDPVANRAEYLSEWRSDVEGFIPREIVERCVRDWIELPPYPNVNYSCFVDPATGVPKGDSYAIVIAHKVGDRAVIDVIREIRPPFNAFEVVNNVLVPLCKQYRIYKVVGDNFAGDLAKDPIRRAGIGYDVAQKHKSDLYVNPFLGMLNADKIDLPNNERAISQICTLERSLQRSGREQISHPTHGHDDIANAIAGAVDLVYGHFGYDRGYSAWQAGFVDRDVVQRSVPQPEPPQANGNWWKSMPRSQPTFSADDRLRGLYQSLDFASKSGFFR